MTIRSLTSREWLGIIALEAVLVDGFDDCIIGVGHRIGMPPMIVYDKWKILHKLVKVVGIPEDEAEEYFEYNIVGQYVGEATPIFTEAFK